MRTWIGVIGRLVGGLLGLSVLGGFAAGAAASTHAVGDQQRVDTVDIQPEPPVANRSMPAVLAGEHIERHELTFDLQADGSAEVTETIVYDFNSGFRRGIFRDLIVRQKIDEERDRLYPVSNIDVSSPDAPAQWTFDGKDPTLRLKIGDPERYAPSIATYQFSYRVEGAVDLYRDNPQVEDHDEFYWNATGHDWDISRNAVLISVTGPAAADDALCFAGLYGAATQCTDAAVETDGSVTFYQGTLTPNEGVTIAASFPPGTFPGATPIVEEKWSAEKTFGVSAPMAAGVGGLSVVAMAGIAAMTWIIGRDRQGSSLAVDAAFADETTGGSRVRPFQMKDVPVEFVPPEKISPGAFGVLIDEIADDRDVVATIIDLAVRGYLIIEDDGKDDDDIDMKIIRTEKSLEGLKSRERLLIEDLMGFGTSMTIDGASARMATAITNGRRRLYRDMVDEGWFGQDPFVTRSTWTTMGLIVGVFGVALLGLLTFIGRWAVAAIPVILVGAVLISAARLMPARTPRGTGVLRRSLGFQKFLLDSEAPRARFAEDNSILTDYLPYVIAIGETERWAKTFDGLQAAQQPSWYRSDRPFRTRNFIYVGHHMGRSANIPAQTPASSRGGFNSGGGFGGGGFGGGGFSGGGGGGGGGGSW